MAPNRGTGIWTKAPGERKITFTEIWSEICPFPQNQENIKKNHSEVEVSDYIYLNKTIFWLLYCTLYKGCFIIFYELFLLKFSFAYLGKWVHNCSRVQREKEERVSHYYWQHRARVSFMCRVGWFISYFLKGWFKSRFKSWSWLWFKSDNSNKPIYSI